jgi:uncharacterized membrane protein
MIKLQILSDKRRLLFIFNLCITVGAWVGTFNNDWHIGLTPVAISSLFILLANNVFSNAIKNVGVFGAGVTNESDPKTQEGVK